jgi:murein L,D-transpeptidase YcbB/YkuD
MKRIIFIAFILFATLKSGAVGPGESIMQFIDNKIATSRYEIDNEYLLSGKVLPMFYANRNYTPAWFNNDTLGNNGYILINFIRQVDRHGLQPNDYHLELIEKYVEKTLTSSPVDTSDMMKLDVLLSDAFMLLGSHLYYGKVDPEKEGWKVKCKDPELRLDLKLEEALAANDPAMELDMLAPRYRSYWMMKDELVFFLGLNEQLWPSIQSVVAIKPGESNQLIAFP